MTEVFPVRAAMRFISIPVLIAGLSILTYDIILYAYSIMPDTFPLIAGPALVLLGALPLFRRITISDKHLRYYGVLRFKSVSFEDVKRLELTVYQNKITKMVHSALLYVIMKNTTIKVINLTYFNYHKIVSSIKSQANLDTDIRVIRERGYSYF